MRARQEERLQSRGVVDVDSLSVTFGDVLGGRDTHHRTQFMIEPQSDLIMSLDKSFVLAAIAFFFFAFHAKDDAT